MGFQKTGMLPAASSLRQSRKEEKVENGNKQLECLYQDRLPEEILEALTPEVRRQYFLWDEIMKREIQLYPWLILPVVKEIFHKEYSAGKSIVLLSTEYTVSRVYEKGEKLLQAIRSDILMRISVDLYHFECQIEKDGKMVFRMLEYDMNIALTHGKAGRERKEGELSGGFWVSFPKSAILYLGNERKVPEYETCMLRFQDGSSHLYRIPVMRVQGYGLKEIEEKHLNILIPFLVVRFREQIKKISEWTAEEEKEAARKRAKESMTAFILESLTVLENERQKGILSETVEKDIGEFLWKACCYLLEEDRKLYREVSAEVEPAIKLSREIIEELREDIQGLQDDNRELINRNNALHQELEDAFRELVNASKMEGKSTEETVNLLMKVFSLGKEDAEKKVRAYWKGA